MSHALRPPPHNVEAEEGVLGALLQEPARFAEVAEAVDADDFYRDAHALVFRAVAALADAGSPVDSVSVADELSRRGALDRAGGVPALVDLQMAAPHAANAAYHAAIVRQKATARRLIGFAEETLRECYGDALTAEQLLASAEERVFALSHRRAASDVRPLAGFVREASARFETRRRGEVAGVGTGFGDVDALTDGLQPGQLVILAARPSMGKTALALQVCEHATFESGVPALFVSLEMPGVELAERLLVSRSGVDGHRLRAGHALRPRDADRLARVGREAEAVRGFWVDQSATRTAPQVAAQARRFQARHGVGLLAVDYLQLLDPGETRDSRQEQVAKMSRRLKAVAMELSLPVLCLSQLNRQAETRDGHRPRLGDLRESGAIEQDADLVLLLHRPEYYDPNDQPGVAELIVAKNRNGRTGTVKLVFEKSLARFRGFSPLDPPPDADAAAF